MAGLTLLIQGAAYLNDWRNLRFDALVAVTLALVGGGSLLARILTPTGIHVTNLPQRNLSTPLLK